MFSFSCLAVTPQHRLCGKPTTVLDGQRQYCTDDHRYAKRNDIAFQRRIAAWRKNSPEVLVAKRAYDSAMEAVRAARRAGTSQVSALQKITNTAARDYLKAVELSRERQYPGILEAERDAREEERKKRNADEKAAQEAEKERHEDEKAYDNQQYYANYLETYKQSLKTMKSEKNDELEFIRYRSETKIRMTTVEYESARRKWLEEYREWLQYSLFDEPRCEENDKYVLKNLPDEESEESQKERNEAFAAQMAVHVAIQAIEEEDAAMTDEARVTAAEADAESQQIPYCIASLNLLNAVHSAQSKGMSFSRAMESVWAVRYTRTAAWIRLEVAKHRLKMAYYRNILTRLETAPERVFHPIEHHVWNVRDLFLPDDAFEAPVFARDPEGSIDLRAFAADSQNVHRSGTISATEAAIHRLCEIPCVCANMLIEIFELLDTSAPELRAVIADDYNLVHAFNYSYAKLLCHVWGIIRSHEYRVALETRFIDEVRDGEEVCHTGKMTRLVNVLAGFHDAVGDLMPPMELFRNRIALLASKPLMEREASAKELFREFAIPEAEQEAWLEPLLEA